MEKVLPWSKLMDQALKRLVVMVSGNGSNLQAIIEACESGSLAAKVVAVISDRQAAYALKRARQHQISTECHPWKPYRETGCNREDYDADLANKVADYQPNYVVLAGWMRLLTMAFLEHFPLRVINLHPALPGMFPGTHAIERAFQAFQRGEIEYTGVMVHFVPNEGVDNGPVIAQQIVQIQNTDTVEELEERIHKIEHRILIEALSQVFQQN
jgi:formyltetrahydrofolate-dependent phosphoribosylglycinamide formyltransferase